MAKKTAKSFESIVEKLDQIVDQLENGKLDLEKSLQKFAEGIELSKHGQKILQQAEQKVQILLSKNGETQLKNFEDLNDQQSS